MIAKPLLGLALVLGGCCMLILTGGCTTSQSKQTDKTNAIIGTWHLVSVDMPAEELNKLNESLRASGVQMPDVDLRFKTNGTYEYVMTITTSDGYKAPVEAGNRWFLSEGILHINAVSLAGLSNLVMQVHLSGDTLTFEKDPVIFPYVFKSVYKRTTNNLAGPRGNIKEP